MKWSRCICSLCIFFSFFSGFYAQEIVYSTAQNNELYLGYTEFETGDKEEIKAIDLFAGDETVTKLSLIGKSQFHWKKHGDNFFVIWRKPGYNKYGLDFLLKRFETNNLNSAAYIQERNRRIDSLVQIYGTEDLAWAKYTLEQAKKSNPRAIVPLNSLFEKSISQRDYIKRSCGYSAIQYDFIKLSEQKFWFLIRSCLEITIWEYDYPSNFKEESDRSNWREVKTFSLDTVPFWGFIPLEERMKLPSGKRHYYQAIQDSSFFDGGFKIIQQRDNTFCINSQTGFIYHIGDQDIARVGALDVKDYPSWIFGKPLFIEDRDAGELVFFAAVERVNTKRPFPKIVSLPSKEALYERYPGLKGK